MEGILIKMHSTILNLGIIETKYQEKPGAIL